MAQMIDIITDELEQFVQMSKQANAAITDAAQLLQAITVHTDWQCPQRDMIIDNTNRNRADSLHLMEHAERYYQSILQASEEFKTLEGQIDTHINVVDGLLGDFLSRVPSGGGGGHGYSSGHTGTPAPGSGHTPVAGKIAKSLTKQQSLGELVWEKYVPKITKAVKKFGDTIDAKSLMASMKK